MQTADTRIYGGVRLNRYFRETLWNRSAPAWKKVLRRVGLVIDLPLSAVLDTAFLPFTVPGELLAPQPSSIPEEEEYVVAVKSRRVGYRRLWWAHHYFIHVKTPESDRWRTFAWRGGGGDGDFRGREPPDDAPWEDHFEHRLERVRLHAVYTGERAREIAAQLEKLDRTVRGKRGRYRVWPGPNSNTYVADMGRSVGGLAFDIDHNASGKDYTRYFQAGVSTTKIGVAVDTWPLGVQLGLIEGIELHFFQGTLGVSFFPPALKLPFLQRLGFPAWVPSD